MNARHWRPAYVGVGSNLDSPVDRVEAGIAAMSKLPDSRLVLQSDLYQSEPLGCAEQPDFINAVVALMTRLEASQFLQELQAIERAAGRTRDGARWGPRILDLDLLALGGMVIDEDDLVLPHPRVAERNFVLLPWREIAPHFRIPGLSSVAALAARVPDTPRIKKLA